MKRFNFVFILALTLFFSCKPSPKDAAVFNDRLMSEQKKVIIKYDELLETYDTYVAKKMDAALLEFQEQVDNSIATIKTIPAIKEGENLKDAILEYLAVYKGVAEDESQELVRLYKVPENEFSPEMRVTWDSKYKAVDTKLKEADKKLQAVQASFAENYHLHLAK